MALPVVNGLYHLVAGRVGRKLRFNEAQRDLERPFKSISLPLENHWGNMR